MTNSPIKAIIFDCGNVLLERNPKDIYQRHFPNDFEGREHFLEEVDFMNWNAQQDKGRTFAEGVMLSALTGPGTVISIMARKVADKVKEENRKT